MKKKIMLILLSLLMGSAFSFASSNSSNPCNVNLINLSDRFKNRLSFIHFYNWTGNNIQNAYAFILVKRVDFIEWETIELNGKKIKCNGKLRWYYVNLARWNYLYPLSPEDKDNFITLLNGDENVELTWWFYTSCVGEGIDNNSIVWYIGYKRDNMLYFKLYAWFKFNVYENEVKFNNWFVNNLKLVNWVVPIWFIYDTVWWVWFVWGKIDNGIGVHDLNNWSNENNLNIAIVNWEIKVNDSIVVSTVNLYATARSLVWIKWLFNVSNWSFGNLDEKELFMRQISVEEWSYGEKRISYNAGLVKFSDINNIARKNAENICRNRQWEEINTTIEFNNRNNLDEINCFKWNGKIIINYDPTDRRKNTIIVSKWVDVVISKSMKWNWYMEMYIDKARLLINNNIDLLGIWESWEPVNNNEVTSWAVIKWLFVINWLIWGYENGSYTWFEHKLYVLWQFASLNTLSNPNQARINFVRNLLDQNINNENINLLRIFNWRCEENGIWTDRVNCSDEKDKWWQNSIIFISKKNSYKLLR